MTIATVRNVLTILVLAAVAQAANEVKVTSYAFDGSKLTGALSVQNIAYTKVINVIYANNAQTWGNTCAASYTSGPDSSNKEVWSFNCAIGSAGITQFYVEYKVNGQTYYDNNGGYGVNYQVKKFAPAPTTKAPTPTPTTKLPIAPPPPTPTRTTPAPTTVMPPPTPTSPATEAPATTTPNTPLPSTPVPTPPAPTTPKPTPSEPRTTTPPSVPTRLQGQLFRRQQH